MASGPELSLLVAYLGVLAGELADEPWRDRILAEAEAHLYEATERGRVAGLCDDDAQRTAIQAFGAPDVVADAVRRSRAEPLVFDARQQLSAAALGELRQARRLALAVKDGRTAVLGYWTPDRYGAIVLRRRDSRPGLGMPLSVPPTISLDIARNKMWQQVILPRIYPGIELAVENWDGRLRLWLGPIRDAPPTHQQIGILFPSLDWSPPQVR